MTDYPVREYPSNTLAGTCNNYMLFSEETREITGRVFYKVTVSGKLPYRFFFDNTVDTTFDDGSLSKANLMGDALEVVSAFAGDGGTEPGFYNGAANIPLSFEGEPGYNAAPGEGFCTDEVTLTIPEGHYLVFEWTVRGKNIPYTPDKIIPCYIWEKGGWRVSREFPQPVLVGAKRKVRRQVAFLGDSITQGLGTREDLYEFWAAKIAQGMPEDVSVWNLGLGFARAQDSATHGTWLKKAGYMDAVNLCLGTNDAGYFHTGDEIIRDVAETVDALTASGVEVGIFTLPPFDYEEERGEAWEKACRAIKNEISKKCMYCLEPTEFWGMPAPYTYASKWGGHPNGEGCALLAKEFLKRYGELLAGPKKF